MNIRVASALLALLFVPLAGSAAILLTPRFQPAERALASAPLPPTTARERRALSQEAPRCCVILEQNQRSAPPQEREFYDAAIAGCRRSLGTPEDFDRFRRVLPPSLQEVCASSP
ncbi:MAG: hypothetical protein U0271_12515 [Polyangiaceae bacterium]